MLAVVTWDGGAGTLNWTDANNWDTNTLPSNADSAVIPDLLGTPTIFYESGTRSVASIQTDEAISITGGSLTDSGNLSGLGKVNIAGGTFGFSGINWANTSSLILSAGTLDLGGSFTLNQLGAFIRQNGTAGTVNLTGTMNLTGSTLELDTLNNGMGSWNIPGGTLTNSVANLPGNPSGIVRTLNGAIVTLVGATLNRITIDSNSNFVQPSSFSTTNVTNGLTVNGHLTVGGPDFGACCSFGMFFSGGSQTLDGSGDILLSGGGQAYLNLNSAGMTLVVGPRLTIHGTGGAIRDNAGGGTLINHGIIAVDGGSLAINVPTFINAIDGRLQASNASGVLNVNPGTFTNQNPNGISVSTGTFSVSAGNWTNDGSFNLSGGTLSIAASTWPTQVPVTMTGGTLNIGGSLTPANLALSRTNNVGTVNLTGTMNLSGTTLVLDALNHGMGSWNILGGTLTNSVADLPGNPSGIVRTLNGAIVTLLGATLNRITIDSNSDFLQPSSFSTTNVTNGLTVNGHLTVGGPDFGSCCSFGMFFSGGSQTLGGTGDVLLSGGGQAYLNLNSSGMTLTVGPSLTVHGTGGSIRDNAGGGTLTNHGIIAAEGGSLSISVPSFNNAIDGQLQARNATGTLNINPGTFINLNPNAFSVSTGTLSVSTDVWTNAGSFNLSGGTLSLAASTWPSQLPVTMTGGTLNIGGSLTPDNLDLSRTNNAGTVNLTGTMNLTGTTLVLDKLNNGMGSWNILGGTLTNGGTEVPGIPSGVVRTLNGAVVTLVGSTLNRITIDSNSNFTLPSSFSTTVVTNGLTVNGHLTVGGPDFGACCSFGMYFSEGSQTLNGSGDVLLSGGGQAYLNLNTAGMTLTVGPSLTIHGTGGGIRDNAGSGTLLNHGIIAADAGSLSISVPSLINALDGRLQVSNAAGVLNISNITNGGTMTASAGTMNLNGTWTNSGTLQATGGNANLSGTWSNAGTIRAVTGGIINAAASAPANLVDGTLTGGIWQVYANSTLRLSSNVTTNAATILLDGTTSNIYRSGTGNSNALIGLHSNATAGSLTISSGNSFRPVGTFTNNGILNVDGTSTFGIAATAPVAILGRTSSFSADGNSNDGTGANNATLVNGATYTAGVDGQAFLLDGINDYISIPDSTSLQSTNLTAEGWFRFDSSPSGLVVLFNKPLGSGFQDSYGVWYVNGEINYGISDGNFSYSSFPYTPEIGVWHHITFTFDDPSNAMTVYIDGVQSSSLSTNKSIVYDAQPHLIGADIENGTYSYFFPGAFDQVRYYNRALTPTEVRNNYLEFASTRFVQAGGTATIDGSANSQNAVSLTGGTLKGNGILPTNLNQTGGIAAPGNSPGCLTVNGNYNQSGVGALEVEVDGATVCSQYDQLIVNGTVTLGGDLDLALLGTYTPTIGQLFTVISNDNSDAVSGIFSGLPERQVFATNTTQIFQISYVGGTGNDVVLKYLGRGAIVTTTAPTGPGSIYEAIATTNHDQLGLIAFSIPASQAVNGTYLIDGANVTLDTIVETVNIDATTQREYVDRPVIELYSSGGMNGLSIGAEGTQIRGLSLTGWTVGIDVWANDVLIAGNYVGLKPDGSIPVRKNPIGIRLNIGVLNTTIGGTTSLDRNVISANDTQGIYIRSAASNIVQGNFIGTDPTGRLRRENGTDGILIQTDNNLFATDNTIGGTVAGAGNLISGNNYAGIRIQGFYVGDFLAKNNTVVGNLIGTDIDGTHSLGNSVGMVLMDRADQNTIGGRTSAERNIISGNNSNGIEIHNSVENIVEGNFIGLDITGASKLGNANSGVVLADFAFNNLIGGSETGSRNIISGNSETGVVLDSSDANRVWGNYIGTNESGSISLANSGSGIMLRNHSHQNSIGTYLGTGKNLIVGPTTGTATGIDIQNDAHTNDITANWFGLNAAGTATLGTFGNAISVSASNYNNIGGIGDADGNVIVQYSGHGIILASGSTGNRIFRNYLGIGPDGQSAMFSESFGNSGIAVLDSPETVIGGLIITVGGGSVTYQQLGNLIGGNQTGIEIAGSRNTQVQNNYIGLNSTGTAAIPNYTGILFSGAVDSLVGGIGPNERNIISGNSIGLLVTSTSSNTTVSGNLIGTNAAGSTNPGIPNTIYGVAVDGGTGTTISDNTIVRSGTAGAQTSNDGVRVVAGDVVLRRNLIHHNLGPSISVTVPPGIITLTQARVDGFVLGTISDATPNTTFTIEFFSATLPGQAELYVGSSAVVTDNDGSADFEISGLGDLQPAKYLTATITGPKVEGGDLLQTSQLADGLIPTAAIIRGLPSRSPEGTPISLKAFAVASSINGYAITGYQWNVLKNGFLYTTGTEAGIQFAPDDEGTYTVTLMLTLTNASGNQQTVLLGPHSINVFNVAPTPQFDYSPTSPRLGQLLTLKSNSSDPGQLDLLSYAWEVRYGSATGAVVFSTASSSDPAAAIASFTPTAGGIYFAKLTVDDNDGGATGFRSLTRQIEVSGLPSTVVILAPATGSEGQTVRARVPESELIRAEQFGFTWTVTKTPAIGPSSAYPFTLPSRGVVEFIPDDNGVYQIALSMQELAIGNNLVATPVDVVITNASPIVAVNSPSNSASIGSPINVVAAITDPGTADTHTLAWSVERNGQLLSGVGTVGNPPTNFSFTPTRGGVYTIQAIATDDDYSATTGIGRGTGQRVFYVTDIGVALSVNGPAGPYTEATAYSFTSTLGTLPSGVTVSSYVWSAQNINGRVVQSQSASASTVDSFAFIPPQGGLFLVSLSVVFSDGRVASAAFAPINVIGLAPVIDSLVIVSPASNVALVEGLEITVRASATDLGEPIGLGYRWQLKRGNGTFVDVDGISNKPSDMRFTPTDDDTYTVRVIVTDSQGNSVQLDRAIVVANAAPSVRLEVLAVAGTSVTFNALGSDPGLDDRPGLTYAWSLNGGAFVTGTSQFNVNLNSAVNLAVRVTDDTTGTIVSSYIYADTTGTNSETIDAADEALAGTADQIVYLGLGGNDVITIAAGLTKKVVVFGGDDDDTINASAATGPVYLDGGSDNDTLTSGIGDDVLVAGTGTNILIGGNGNNRFVGGGNDTMTGGVNNDYYEVHFSTVVLNDVGGGEDTVDLTAAPAGVTLDFSETNNVAQSVFPTSQVGDPYHGSTLKLNGTFQSLIGSPFGDNLSASTPGVKLSGGAGNDTLSATGPDSSLDGGADNDLLVLSNASGVISGGDGNDTFTGTLANTQTTVLDGGEGDDTWTITGPSTGAKATVAITGGTGANTITASNIKGKITTEGGNATGLLSEFGSVRGPSKLNASITNSTDVSIFGSSTRGSSIAVTNSNDVSIFGGGGDSISLMGLLRGTVQGGLFGGVSTNNALLANLTNSNDVSIFGSSTQSSSLASLITNSNNVSIFGGIRSQIAVTNSNDVSIFGASEGSISIGALAGLLSSGIQVHISAFGSTQASPILSLSVTNSTDVGIFGSSSATSAPLLASVTNSSDVSIFGSSSRNVSLQVVGSQDVGIFGVVDGTIRLGPSDPNTAGQGVTRATIETDGFGSASTGTSLSVLVTNSNDVGIFGSSAGNSRPLNATVTNSSDVSIFGSVVRGGIIQATNSQDVGIFAQASSEVMLEHVLRGNVFAETFGTGQLPTRLSISVSGNSNDVGIFGSSTRNSSIAVSNSNDVHIFGGTAVNTLAGDLFVGDSVSFSTVTSGTIAGGIFGAAPPAGVTSPILQASLLNSSDIAVFGSARGVSNVVVVNSQDVSIYGGYGDVVDLMASSRVRVEGGVFGSATANQSGLTVSVAGNSVDVGIFGTSVNDAVTLVAGTRIGVDSRAGADIIAISNVDTFVGLTDAGDDTVTVHSGNNILLYLAAGKDRAQVNGGSNIRIIGAEDDDEFFVTGGSIIDLDGGDGADTFVYAGGSSLSVRSDAGNDIQKIFGGTKGYFGGGLGDETTQFYGGSGVSAPAGQIDVVIDGQSGNDTLEIGPLLTELTRTINNLPNPFDGIPAWIVLPPSIFVPTLNRNPSSAAVLGGDGDDTLTIEGNQRLYALGGDGNDVIHLIAGSNSFAVGGSGNDTIDIHSPGVDNYVFGDEGNDTIDVFNGIRLGVFSEQGDDSVTFYGGSQSYARTGAGQDTLTVYGGNDLIVSAEDGFDVINLNDGTNILAGGGFDGDEMTINGGTNPIALGESGNDHLKFNYAINAILSGGDGDDLIEALGRDADFYGDDGDDTYKILPVSSPTSVQLRLRELQFISPKNFEAEARGDDTIDLSAFSMGSVLDLRNADSLQSVIAGQLEILFTGSFEGIIGTGGNDTLTGTNQQNRLDGRGGNDTLIGLAGDDTLIGGLGNDSLDGGVGDDAYRFETTAGVGLGNDTILENTSSGTDAIDFSGLPVGLGSFDMNNATGQSLAGGLLNIIVKKSSSDASVGEIEDIVGTIGNDTVIGNPLDNRFEMLAGNDMVDGGSGSDIYVYRGRALGSDTISDSSSGTGRDTLDFTGFDAPIAIDLALTTAQNLAGQLSLTFTAIDSIENVVGTSFNDTILGNGLENALYGAAGSDTLDGRSGNDRIVAGLPAVVLLDFDSAYSATRGDYNYSVSERNAIQQRMEADYAAFDWRFAQSESTAKALTADSGRSFVRLTFSQGRGGGVSGDAGEVDFRNINRRIISEVNINSLKSTIAEILGPGYSQQAFSDMVVALTTTIASHELGHTAGLRHADAFGPVGTGVYVNANTDRIYPPYTGPLNAVETPWHLSSSPASVGSTIEDAARDLFFGERESIKLAFNEMGQTRLELGTVLGSHGTLATAEDLVGLGQMAVPNLLPATGFANSGKVFDVSALAVVGELKHTAAANSTEVDYYRFTGRAGEYVNVELLANSLLPLRGEAFDGALKIFKSDGTLISENDDDLEGTKDATLLDVQLPADGQYYVAVSLSIEPSFPGQGGRYELFLSRFSALASGASLPTVIGDTLIGGAGADTVQGGYADDFFTAAGSTGGDLTDLLNGGPGQDTLDLLGLDYLYTATSIESIINPPAGVPTLIIGGATAGAIGQPLAFSVTMGNVPTGATLSVDWGDTTSESQAASDGELALGKSFTSASTEQGFKVTATLRNVSNAVILARSISVVVTPTLVVDEGGQRVLHGGSTLGKDIIVVRRISDTQFGLKLTVGGTETVFDYGSGLTPVQRVVLYGLDGNDTITVDQQLQLPVSLYGGSGNDILRAGGGNDILVGGDGIDQLYGFGGSDLLIGGTGRDTLYGAGDQDIMVAGWTVWDDNALALQTILSYWTSNGSDTSEAWYQTRVTTLRDVGVGAGGWRLNAMTTIDDNALDTLYAAASLPVGATRRPNWYLRNTLGTGTRDSLIGGMASEESTDNRDA